MCLSKLCLPAGYLNVLVNSQWKSRWCQIKDGHLHFYQDKNRSKLAQQPLSLAGCEIIPEPSPDHLYSFRILHNGEERVVLEVGCLSLRRLCLKIISLGTLGGLNASEFLQRSLSPTKQNLKSRSWVHLPVVTCSVCHLAGNPGCV